MDTWKAHGKAGAAAHSAECEKGFPGADIFPVSIDKQRNYRYK